MAAAGRRRMVSRVIARTKARARAARPASWAPMTGAPSGSADVSATGRVCSFWFDCARPVLGVGLTVGNRPAALPPGLRVEPTTGLRVEPASGMLGRTPTGSAEVTVSGSDGTPTGSCGAAGFCGGV